MVDDFKIVAITPEHPHNLEAPLIEEMLDCGAVDYVHLRHPGYPIEVMQIVLDLIDPRYYPQIKLHPEHHPLLSSYPGLREHGPKGSSRSCHFLDELSKYKDTYDYCFLSPIYPSISKPGYQGDFEPGELMHAVRECPTVALGGVTPDRFGELAAMGFSGAAMLGYFWHSPEKFFSRLRRVKMMRPGRFDLQYITRGSTPDDVVAETRHVLERGCRWVQVRMKDADDDTLVETLERVRPLCKDARAILLVDDHVKLVDPLRLDGVHLGKEDMDPAKARLLCFDKAIIGGTANTFDDIVSLADKGVDYIGLGPYRYTTTKKNLAPILGLQGYQSIMRQMHEQGIDLPVVAIGGITAVDAPAILATGVSGIAASGAIDTFLNKKR